MTQLHFASPGYFALLLIPILVLIRSRRSPVLLYPHHKLVQSGLRSWRLRLHAGLPWLQALALALLVTAVARPQLGQAERLAAPVDTEIVFALDVSDSMMALDLSPHNRLAAAKQLISDFSQQYPYQRIGLVIFAAQAYIQTPPTRDHERLRQAVAGLDLASNMGISDGTAIGLGIATAAGLLVDSPVTHRAVVLLTDGAETSHRLEPQTAAVAAAQLGIQVYTVGIGQPGLAPFPQPGSEGMHLVYWESPLDEAALQEIADITQAMFYRAEDAAMLSQAGLDIAARAGADEPPVVRDETREMFFWLAGVAFALLGLEMALRQTVVRTLL